MTREELIIKIENQRGLIDYIDAFIICDVYTDLYGIEIGKDKLDIEDELIYMWVRIKNYKPGKICSFCGEKKMMDEFHNNKSMIDKKQRRCKECSIKSQIKYKENRNKKKSLSI
jgi:hypothetical protein